MTVLPDTSVWVDYLRRGYDGKSWELDGLLARGEVTVCGPVVAELIAGAVAPSRDELWITLSGLPWSELGRSQWRRVGEVAAALRTQGKTAPLTGVEIAVAAEASGAELWSRDEDFDRIGEVLTELRRFRP